MSYYQNIFSQKISSLIQQLELLNVSTNNNQVLQPYLLDQFPELSIENIQFFNLFQNLDTKSIIDQLQVKNYNVFNNNFFLILLIICVYQNTSCPIEQQKKIVVQIYYDYQSASEQKPSRNTQGCFEHSSSGLSRLDDPLYQKILEMIQQNNDIFVIASSNIKDIIKNKNVINFIDNSLEKYKNNPSFKKILNIFNDFQKSLISKDSNNKFNFHTQNIKISNILRNIASILDEEHILHQIQSDFLNTTFSVDDFTEILQNVLSAIHQNIDPDTFQKSQQMFLQFYSYVQSAIDIFGQQITQYFPTIRRHHLQKILDLLKIIKIGFESIDKKKFQHTAIKTKILELQKQRSKKSNQTQIRIKQ